MEHDCDTVALLGVTVSDRSISLPEDPAASESVGRFLQANGIRDTACLVGIHPGGKPSRRWPIERFVLLVQRLAKIKPLRFVVTGTPGERALFEALTRQNATAIVDSTGRFNFNELVAFIRRCNLFIANDTGPLHIAAALKRPLVAIFGPGEIVRYDPRNISDKAQVLYHRAACAPCNNYICKDPFCITAITVDEVCAAAQRMLEVGE
jgi:heptosyltransferase-2